MGLLAEMLVRTYSSRRARAPTWCGNSSISAVNPVQIRLRIRCAGLPDFGGRETEAIVTAMTDALAHRGPDGDGYHVDEDGRIFLGHRRLAIIDIGGGAQPMWNEDRHGRRRLQRRDLQPRRTARELDAAGIASARIIPTPRCSCTATRSGATELPLRLNGMFAFAIYDQAQPHGCSSRATGSARSRCFTPRRRMAIRVRQRAYGACGAIPEVDTTLDVRSLQKLFAYGFIPALSNALQKRCEICPAGHWLLLDLESDSVTLRRYWKFSLQPDASLLERDEEDLADELDSLLTQAVKRQADQRCADRAVSERRDRFQRRSRRGDPSDGPCSRSGRSPSASTKRSFDESDIAQARVAGIFGTQHRGPRTSISIRRVTLIPRDCWPADEPLGDPFDPADLSVEPVHARGMSQSRCRATAATSCSPATIRSHALKPAAVYSAPGAPGPLHRTDARWRRACQFRRANMSLDFKLRRALTGLSYSAELSESGLARAALEPRDMRQDLRPAHLPERTCTRKPSSSGTAAPIRISSRRRWSSSRRSICRTTS